MKYQIKMNYFELPYFNMSTVASLPLCLRRILLSAIMMSISATLSSSSSFPVSMNKFVSPTIDSVFEVAAICYCWFMWHNKTISPSSLPVCRYVSLSRTMNVHLSSSSIQDFCIWYSSSSDRGSEAVSFWSSSDVIHWWYLATWISRYGTSMTLFPTILMFWFTLMLRLLIL